MNDRAVANAGRVEERDTFSASPHELEKYGEPRTDDIGAVGLQTAQPLSPGEGHGRTQISEPNDVPKAETIAS